MIGNRIRLIRLANCLSLQQLTDRMNQFAFPITKTALFNYEAGKTVPNEQTLQMLARVLGVHESFFHRDDWADFSLQLCDSLGSVSARRQELFAYIEIELEFALAVSKSLGYQFPKVVHEPMPVRMADVDGIERAVEQLHEKWHIGQYQIASVCGLLERNGWVLFSLPHAFLWDCVSGQELSSGLSFLFFSPEPYLDELRVKLVKALGKHVLSYPPHEEEEVLAYFTRAFLLPRGCVLQEFGQKRKIIDANELKSMKQKYGVARRDILRRLRDCDIISDEYHDGFVLRMQQTDHMLRTASHHVPLSFFEEPTKVHMLVKRAVAENLVSDQPVLSFS